jgi:hypothetical protein
MCVLLSLRQLNWHGHGMEFVYSFFVKDVGGLPEKVPIQRLMFIEQYLVLLPQS